MPGSHKSPSARYRIHQFYDAFKTLDYDVKIIITFPDRENDFPEAYDFLKKLPPRVKQALRLLSCRLAMRSIKRGDIVITNRDIVPEPGVTWFEEHLNKKGAKLIFDFDDAIFLGARKEKLNKVLPFFSWIVAGNDYLLDFAKTINPNSSIIPTVVDTKFYTAKIQNERKPKLTVGWSGSSGTAKMCLPLLRNVMEQVSKKMDFTFLVIADKDPHLDWDVKDIRFKKWTPETEVEGIKQIDIGLMPLSDTEFERGKCGLKAIQYMAVGTPAIVSPVGVNEKIVTSGVNGYHALTDQDWIKYILELLEDHTLRKEMGEKARQTVLEKYSVEVAFEQWREISYKIDKP